MKICPACHSCYDDTAASCSKDHTALVMERAGTRLLVGKYQLECLLGRGDKGTAYEAIDTELDSPVIAVELHGTKVIDDPEEMKRFHHEARQVVRAGGQDVADIYDYGSLPNGRAYVVMERIKRDVEREDLIAKTPLSVSATTENVVAPPLLNDHRRASSETPHIEIAAPTLEAPTVESTEETITSPYHAEAASAAMARLTEDETLAFPAPETASGRVVKDDDAAAVAIDKPPTLLEPSFAPPVLPAPPVPPLLATTPTPSATPNRSTQLAPPIIVKVPDGGSGRNNHRSLIYAGLAAALTIISAATWFTFNRQQAPSPNPPVASVTSPAADTSTTSQPTNSLPATSQLATKPPATQPILSASTESTSSADAIADNVPPVMKTKRRVANVRAQSPRVVLSQNLDDWVAAHVVRDVEGQMSFYMPVLTTFYRQSDVAQEDVREEKARLLTDTRTGDVRLLSKPQITFSEGGRVATMRVLLSGVAQNGEQQQSGGRVMRELRWRKTDAGWKIFSERDV